MLVLTRKTNERICIGDNITLTVVKIDGRKVRLGIEAPKEVIIRREECDLAYGRSGTNQDPVITTVQE